ncbi:MAG: hypothetical protein WBP59_09295 [Ilumatobacteraceae bacterium]
MPKSVPDPASVPATPAAAPVMMSLSTTALSPKLLTPVFARTQEFRPLLTTNLQLAVLRNLTIAPQLQNAPLVNAAPSKVDQAIAGADGTPYYVPRARIAERSKATHAPYVFLERREGAVRLQVWFDLTIADPAGTALPVDGYAVSLVGSSGRIDFGRCDELPPTDKPDGVVAQLFCEAELTPEQTNQVVGMMQTDGDASFRVTGNVHYSLGASAGPAPKGRRRRPRPADATVRDQRVKVAPATARLANIKVSTKALLSSAVLKVGAVTAKPTPTAAPTQHNTNMSLAPADNAGVRAHFPTSIRQNQSIFAQVTTGFGTEPWAQWVPLQNGRFIESPAPEQFFVLPDEYRLALDPESGMPALMVLLVPPERTEGDEGPTSFGGDYKIRCRFSIVPWYDPERLERLRQEIIDHTGVAYPQLRGGGFRGATCALSRTYESLGSTLVGDGEATVAVDALGFDLVVDCTSEFYNLLSHLMVTDGVGGNVVIDLVADDEHPEQATVPVTLRLDRPALDFLVAELIPPPEPEATPDSDAPETPPAPMPPPRMRITNPIPYAVTVSSLATRLLVVDDTLPTPIGAVTAASTPSSFTIPAADGAPTTLDIELSPMPSDLPALFGGVGVSFIGVSVDIDPNAVLAKAHDLGPSSDLSSAVEARSYQLEHPDVLPETHADLFGIEVQLKRGEAEPITVFLTRDQPASTVQVSFTLADVLAGARPEQPKFEWRRRNMAGAGTGEWSDWETIVGRQLFISPTGL